jgi:hypothetical protein
MIKAQGLHSLGQYHDVVRNTTYRVAIPRFPGQ